MKEEKTAKKQKKDKEWPSNQVELSGYAGKDPKFQRYGESRLKASFTLGTHQLFRDSNGHANFSQPDDSKNSTDSIQLCR